VLPDVLAAFRLVLVEFGFAQLDQVLDLLVVEVLVADKGKTVVLLLDDAVAPEDATDHIHGDVIVVLDLALVVGEDGPSDLRGRTFAACCPEQGQEHDGLVDVGHPHAVLYETGELFVDHSNTVPSRVSRG